MRIISREPSSALPPAWVSITVGTPATVAVQSLSASSAGSITNSTVTPSMIIVANGALPMEIFLSTTYSPSTALSAVSDWIACGGASRPTSGIMPAVIVKKKIFVLLVVVI